MRHRALVILILTGGGCGSDVAIAPPSDGTTASGDGSTGLPTASDGSVASSISETSGMTTQPGDTSSSATAEGDASSTADKVPGCRADLDCTDGTFPFCNAGACVDCADADDPHAACLGADPRSPVCSAGTCVACPPPEESCPAPAPSCDCQPCTSHEECAGGAGCAILTGDCLPATAVYYVDDGGSCPGDGSEATPFCSIQDAVDAIGPEEAGTIRVSIQDPIGSAQAVVIEQGETVALLGTSAAVSILVPTPDGASSILTVNGSDTAVYLDRLRLRSSEDAAAIAVEGATLYATRVEIVQNAGGGVVAGGGAEAWLIGSMIGTAQPDAIAVAVADSTAHVLYSTLVGGSFAPALACTGGSSVDVRNAILLSSHLTPEVDCEGATITTSATEAETGSFNGSQAWFQSFPAGNYHLTPTGAEVFAGLAQWQAGDPIADIDGDPRPAIPRAPDHPGADVPVP
jgi:hypothetical protein